MPLLEVVEQLLGVARFGGRDLAQQVARGCSPVLSLATLRQPRS
jgi:hypothetical protein